MQIFGGADGGDDIAFARRIGAAFPKVAMAADTVLGDSIVIEIDIVPVTGRVAGLTIIATVNVFSPFTRYGVVVVATHTGADHIGVVDPDQIIPLSIVVAMLTHIGRREMIIALTFRSRAIVTTGAVTRHLVMLEIRRLPAIRRMTLIALVIRRDMVRIHIFGMTAATGSDYIGVIHLFQIRPG